jgi:hypothetical protein
MRRKHIDLAGARLFLAGVCLWWGLGAFALQAADTWRTALGRMPLGTNVAELNAGNCAPLMMKAFQSNAVVKALIFMPGATDELYFFRRARAALTNDAPSLLDALNALTNQTRIRATFKPPMLLLHGDSDPMEPLAVIKDPITAAAIMHRRFVPHAVYDDRDWDYLLPILGKTCGVDFRPIMYSKYSFHFYRHTFAAWNLSAWEALEAVSLAGKTIFTVKKEEVIFEGDLRKP